MTSRGFTLVELLVALTVSGLVLLVGGAALRATVSASQDIGRTSIADLTAPNRARWLRRAVASLEVGLPGDVPFDGEPERVRFSAYLLTPRGWWERQAVELTSADGRLVARVGSEVVVLADSLAEVGFDYLVLPGIDSRWTRRWQSPTSCPQAIRLRLGWLDSARTADTLLLLVGDRG
jgi:prepilin-type N-terminal cleavage/methylation domain-containing protein